MRDEEAIQLDRDGCPASAATARIAHLALTKQTEHLREAQMLAREASGATVAE